MNEIDYIDFGSYKGEIIKWKVLKQDDESLLLITDKIIDSMPYNTNQKDETTWEKSSLRIWLNNDFYITAFTEEEKGDILKCDVEAASNPLYNTNPGNSTHDKVFILSISQANKYFKDDNDRISQGTDYAIEKGLFRDNKRKSWWWLRSPGEHGRATANVHSDGSVLNHGIPVFYSSGGVRPVIWIKR
jgi:hypothetical protein